ncbi:MAG: LysR family transcriptional regulator, partial [Myxococcota bacterium]
MQISTELFVGLTAIVAAAEEGSATRAAARLGVTPATCLRRIEAAEGALGVRLFERLPTGLEGTAALEALSPWVEQAMAAARGMLSEVADGLDPAVGVVRIASAPLVSTHILAPAARAFNATYPKITLELVGSNALAHMERLEADIAI